MADLIRSGRPLLRPSGWRRGTARHPRSLREGRGTSPDISRATLGHWLALPLQTRLVWPSLRPGELPRELRQWRRNA